MKFLSLCYHYVRENNNTFPRILGTKREVFEDNICMIQQNYQMIDLDNVLNFLSNKQDFITSKTGMLITFDDGLSDHYEAAKILAEHNVKATFFIPTCIIEEKLPPNPTIIHYCIAKYGISNFLEYYDLSLKKFEINNTQFKISFNKNNDNPWDIIKQIKNIFKYKFSYTISRKILLDIYNNSLLQDDPNIFQSMHLTDDKIKLMIDMGHSIGVHTHSHISVAPSKLTDSEKYFEFSRPKEILEKRFDISVNSFSYPFGEIKDCIPQQELPSYLKEYKLIFTVDEILNTEHTSPYELGRYQPISSDTTSILKDKLLKIENRYKN